MWTSQIGVWYTPLPKIERDCVSTVFGLDCLISDFQFPFSSFFFFRFDIPATGSIIAWPNQIFKLQWISTFGFFFSTCQRPEQKPKRKTFVCCACDNPMKQPTPLNTNYPISDPVRKAKHTELFCTVQMQLTSSSKSFNSLPVGATMLSKKKIFIQVGGMTCSACRYVSPNVYA